MLQEIFNADRFNYLVNNAGVGVNVPFVEATEEQFDSLVNIQFKGTFSYPTIAASHERRRRDHQCLNRLARFVLPGFSAYAAVKGAIEVLTRYQAKELGTRGIKVNAVAPGAIEIDSGGGVVRDNKEINDHVASMIALGRVGFTE